MLQRLCELSKSCKATERGQGIEFESILEDLEWCVKEVEVRERNELWENILCNAKPTLMRAVELCRAELVKATELGHVRGAPRLFLFCDTLVSLTCGSFDCSFIDRAVEAFERYSALVDSEIKLLPAMLSYCICGHVVRAISDGNFRIEEYNNGFADGSVAKANLDRLFSTDYICGLSVGAKDDVAIQKLFDDNGISISDAKCERREYLGELAAYLSSSFSTLNTVLHGDGDVIAKPIDDAAFFGGETVKMENKFINRALTVCTDNRGSVKIEKSADISVALSLNVSAEGKTVRLCDMDGAFQRHRTVYRTFTDSFELTAEIIAPPVDSCCAVRLTAINRTAKEISASVEASFSSLGGFSEEAEARKIKDIGIAISNGRYDVALTSDAQCEYTVNNADGTISAMCDVCVGAFSKKSTLFTVVIEGRASAALLSMFDGMYFDRAQISSQAYYVDKDFDDPVTVDNARFALSVIPPDRFGYEKDDVNYIYERGDGGFTENGYITTLQSDRQKSLVNFLFDGDMFVRTMGNGESMTILSDGSEYGSVNVVLEECGVIWSPLGELSGDGASVELCRGYTTYKSYRNGCVTTLTRTIARGKRAEVFLLTVENRSERERNIDVMFTSQANADNRVVRNGDVVYVLGGNGFALTSSVALSEHCEYREGYLDHGRISKASKFKQGGETPSPTLSVHLSILPHEVQKVAFCRAVINADMSSGMTIEDAERCIESEISYYASHERIVLKSSDPALNIAHRSSLYVACAELNEYMCACRFDRALLSCFGVKYADPDCVMDSILKICEAQEICGRVDVGHKTAIATLLLPLAVIDIVNHVGNCRLLGESVDFAKISDISPRAASVLEHCFRAIDYSILMSTRTDAHLDGAFNALLLHAVRAFSDYCANTDRVKAYSSVSARLTSLVERGHYCVATADIEFDPLGVATAYARYETDGEYAYNAVSELTHKALCGDDDLPLIYTKPCGVTAALYFAVVTEKLLGVSVRGDRAKISPNTAQNTPHIEFDICGDRQSTSVSIDDSIFSGGWQVNVDRISIASDTVTIGDGSDSIILRRRKEVV